MIRTAQLRVYMPVDRVGTFDPHLDPRRAIVRVSDEFVWEGPTADDAYTAEWNDQVFVCPRYPRLRMLEGLLSFRDDHPGTTLTSELAVRRAAQEISRIRSSEPTARSYILTAAWHVPLRWFACFDPATRELYEAPHGTSIRYRTSVHEAAVRISRAVEILEDAGFADVLIQDVSDLEHWLREFAGDGLLELDYDDVARLFDDGSLAFDESGADINRSLSALERLEYDDASLAYAEVAGRWAPFQALAYVN